MQLLLLLHFILFTVMTLLGLALLGWFTPDVPEALFTDLGAGQGAGFTGRGVMLALATSILFVVFYLPSRYLFLVEDYRHPSTWLRLWLVLLPLWIAIFGPT